MDYSFDDIIKKALEQKEVPPAPKHWELMEQLLNTAELQNENTDAEQGFDATTFDKTGNLSATSSPDWDAFESKLNASENTDDLDKIIAAGLTDTTVTTTADWNAFEDLLDTVDVQDLASDKNVIDKTAKQKLQNLEKPYQEETWAAMQERIKEEFSIRRKLIRYKVAEGALMVLAIFTLFNFLPKNEIGQIEIVEKVKESILHKTTKANNKVKASTNLSKQDKQVQAPIAFEESQNIIDIVSTAKSNTDKTELVTSKVTESNTTNSIAKVSTLKQILSTTNDVALQPTTIPTEKEEKNSWFSFFKKKEKETELSQEQTIKKFILAALESKKNKEVKPIHEEQELNANEYKSDYKNVRLGMFTAADFFGVYSPYDKFFNYRPGIVYDANMGGGLLFDFQKNRWHIVTGGAFTPKYYKPGIGSEVIGSFSTVYVKEQLKELHLNILHLPLEVRYDLIQKPKWRLYAASGGSFNFVLNASYPKEVNVLAYSGSRLEYEDIQESLMRSSNLERKNFIQGIAEGGSLPDNTFLTLQFGFGAERFFSNRWSMFLEPIYQQQFTKKGIGPNDDSFRSLSLRMGAKVTLFGK